MSVNTLIKYKDVLIKSLICFWAGFLFSAVTVLIITFLNASGNGEYIEEGYRSKTILFLISVVVSPLTEELVFRKLLFNFICEKKLRINFWLAAIVSSIIFGMFHQTAAAVITAVILGMILCGIYEKEQKIIFDIMLHAGFNLLSFIMMSFG